MSQLEHLSAKLAGAARSGGISGEPSLDALLMQLGKPQLRRALGKSATLESLFDEMNADGRAALLVRLSDLGIREDDRCELVGAIEREMPGGDVVGRQVRGRSDARGESARVNVAPPQPAFSGPPGARMLLMQHWAVIGDVLNSQKPARRVVTRLKQAGKEVHLINPRDTSGTCHADLRAAHAAGARIDVIDLIINSSQGLEQMEQAAELGIKHVFIQPGAGSPEIEALCARAGIAMHLGCVLIEL